jgi:hypothetical protein
MIGIPAVVNEQGMNAPATRCSQSMPHVCSYRHAHPGGHGLSRGCGLSLHMALGVIGTITVTAATAGIGTDPREDDERPRGRPHCTDNMKPLFTNAARHEMNAAISRRSENFD